MNGFDAYQLHRRASTASWVLGAAFAILIGAFFRAQVIQHEKFALQAQTNRLRAIPIEPPRGEIVDRNGLLIAENVPGFSVKLLAPRPDSLRAVLRRFSTVVPLDSFDIEEALRRYRGAPYQPVVVLGDADFEDVSRLEEHRALLPGLIIQSEPKRLYPQGKAVAHLVGYVSEVTEADLSSNRFPNATLGSLVGKAGLEREYDSILRGRAGVRYAEVNARGRLVREDVGSASLPAVAGRQIRTTIDLPLQRYIDSIWPAGVRGAMIAMTPSGEVRAIYSAPTYDPNVFVGGIDAANWRLLNTDSAKPMLNRAINGRYPPASPFKLAISAMALKRGLIDFNTHMPVPCTGVYRLGNRGFKCWKKEGHGSLDLTGAIAKSCDIYFYQVGQRLGLEAIIQDGVLMGFRDRTGIDLPSEISPQYPSNLDYFNKLYRGAGNWSAPATTLNFSIGQGENDQTLASMIQFYAALAGTGEEPIPYIVRPATATRHSTGLSDAQLQGIRRALIAVVEQGTAAASRHQDLLVAGKTGTAQNPHGKDHGWFIGFAPADHPQLIVGGIMEFAEHGTVVAPYVVNVLRRYLLGPEEPTAPRVRLLTDESVQGDSAPRSIQLPDSIPAAPPPPRPDSAGARPTP